MPLDDSHRLSVAFVREVRSGKSPRLVGTAFLAFLPGTTDPSRGHGYAVTAAHVVMSSDTKLRLQSVEGDAIHYQPRAGRHRSRIGTSQSLRFPLGTGQRPSRESI